MLEVWKNVVGYEGCYQVSNLGSVRSLDRVVEFGNTKRLTKGKVLSGRRQQTGYLCVNLSQRGKVKNVEIHKLVAMSFLGHKPCKHEIVVDHIDNNKINNTVSNLQLVSNRRNSSKDQKSHNRSSRFVGVTFNKDAKKWKACIRIERRQYFIGYFETEEEASEWYQAALRNKHAELGYIYVSRQSGVKRVSYNAD